MERELRQRAAEARPRADEVVALDLEDREVGHVRERRRNRAHEAVEGPPSLAAAAGRSAKNTTGRQPIALPGLQARCSMSSSIYDATRDDAKVCSPRGSPSPGATARAVKGSPPKS